MSVHTGDLLDHAGRDIPYVEEATTGSEEDAGVGWIGMKDRITERGILDV